jgi:hypothetical protein
MNNLITLLVAEQIFSKDTLDYLVGVGRSPELFSFVVFAVQIEISPG